MIFATPTLPPPYRLVIERIDALREKLRFATSDALNRWTGFLARMAYARAIHSSNTMEGINVTLDDAVAAVDREEPLKPHDEDWHALVGYREALDYVIQLAKDPSSYEYNVGNVLSLHYMMMKYDLTKFPGRWRPGYINVVNTASNQVVYEGPDATLVPSLMGELLSSLNAKDGTHVIVKAAMAHLNLAMIHPFKDGNGRMARALQTMVLAKEGILSPVFSSIEEYVGRNTGDYYAVLAEVGQGAWHPERDALPWLKFCLTAHYNQAMTLIRRVAEMAELMRALQGELEKRKLHERMLNALIDAALGLNVRNPTYRKQAEVTEQVAKLDLTAMVSNGFLVAKGERRWRHYVASDLLKEIRNKVRIPQAKVDPFAEVEHEMAPKQELLPGIPPAKAA